MELIKRKGRDKQVMQEAERRAVQCFHQEFTELNRWEQQLVWNEAQRKISQYIETNKGEG